MNMVLELLGQGTRVSENEGMGMVFNFRKQQLQEMEILHVKVLGKLYHVIVDK